MNSHILFEGMSFKKSLIGKIWQDGSSVFCFYKNKTLLLPQYEFEDWAKYAFKYLLSKLGRIQRWI